MGGDTYAISNSQNPKGDKLQEHRPNTSLLLLHNNFSRVTPMGNSHSSLPKSCQDKYEQIQLPKNQVAHIYTAHTDTHTKKSPSPPSQPSS